MSIAKIETSPLLWTIVGIERKRLELVRKKAAHTKFLEEHGSMDSKDGGDDASPDHTIVVAECSRLKEDWQATETYLARLRRAYPTSDTRACTGLRISGVYLDEEVVQQRGREEHFLLGGIDESDTDAVLRTYSINSPLGNAVKSHEVGDVVTVRLQSGATYDFEITAIRMPTTEDIVAASTLQPRNQGAASQAA